VTSLSPESPSRTRWIALGVVAATVVIGAVVIGATLAATSGHQLDGTIDVTGNSPLA
jgi:hypothetical protein